MYDTQIFVKDIITEINPDKVLYCICVLDTDYIELVFFFF